MANGPQLLVALDSGPEAVQDLMTGAKTPVAGSTPVTEGQFRQALSKYIKELAT